MTLACWQKQFAESKMSMPLSDAADSIRWLARYEYPMLPKYGLLGRKAYVRRLAQRTVCTELEDILRSAAPWEDYREVIAEYIWPYLRRIARRMQSGVYRGPDGKNLLKADAWVVEIIAATWDIFQRMPGTIPETTSWRIFNCFLKEALRVTEHYRRNN